MSAKPGILAVDHTSELLLQLADILSAEGYQVRPCDSLELALASAGANPPDLILLDIHLASREGLEKCRLFKEGESARNIPVILMGALSDLSRCAEALELGASDYITRPFQKLELLSRVRIHLDLKEANDSLAEQVSALSRAREQLQAEMAKCERVEEEMRRGLELAERSRRAILSSLEDWKLAEKQTAIRARQQSSIAELGQLALTDVELTMLMDRAVSTVARELDADLCQVLELKSDGSEFLMVSGVGWREGVVGSTTVDSGPESLAGYTLQTREPVIITDLRTESRFCHVPILREHGVVSSINTIIGNPEYPYGVLGAHTTRWKSFSVNDVHFLQGVANLLANTWQRKLVESERKLLTTAIEQAGEVIIVTDPRGVIIYVNPAFEKVTGYKRLDVLGKTPRILKSGEQDSQFYEELWTTIASGRTWKKRIINKRKDGKFYTEEATISPVRDATGNILNYVAIKRDITEQLRALEEKTSLEDQLRQAQKVESIGKLAGGVAHDFNNMLNIIIGYGEIVLSQLNPSDPLRAKVSEIVKAGQHSAALTRQLLAFSRRQTLQPEVLDLNAVVMNLERILLQLLGEDIELILPLSGDLSRVKADPSQIEQVILNLALNARDAMPEGGKLIIETDNVELDSQYCENHADVVSGNYVLLAVTDTGCGMDKQIFSQIFEPFFTTKERGKGTGLGLSTVYGIVKQSGGNILAYSEPGLGTTFKIYLPSTLAEPEPKVDQPEEEGQLCENERILIVEDEAPLRALVETSLTSLGYQVSAAANGAEAVALVEEKGLEFDLIVSDVVMPGMTGPVLVSRLRSKHSHLKSLFMSGYTDNAIVHQGLLDQEQFIQKPFSMRSLARKVRELLKGGQLRPELILVVDDHPVNREVAIWLLRDLGFEAHPAENGQVALAALERGSYSLVLMDIQMPELDGFETTRIIRQAEKDKGIHLPVIAMTAHSMDLSQGDCLVGALDDCVSKPLDRDQLLKVMVKWLPAAAGVEAAALSTAPSDQAVKESSTQAVVPIDLEAMEIRYGKKNIKRLLELFIEDAPGQISELAEAIAQKDAVAILQCAHGLKGVFKTMFASSLWYLCVEIETTARKQDWVTVAALAGELESEFSRAQKFLNDKS